METKMETLSTLLHLSTISIWQSPATISSIGILMMREMLIFHLDRLEFRQPSFPFPSHLMSRRLSHPRWLSINVDHLN